MIGVPERPRGKERGLVELTGIDEARAQALIMKARAHWFDETPADAAPAAAAH